MSFTPNNLLIPDPVVLLRDQQHAARLFSDSQFQLLPKIRYMFHVAFSLNTNALRDSEFLLKHKNEINMLVKSVDLPSYNVSADVLNQYNRKKIVQYHHKMGETAIIFHDDSLNLINTLWQNYYKYYYGDASAAKVKNAYSKNAMKNANLTTGRYGLDNGYSPFFTNKMQPFFNYITIYQMTKKEFLSYKLINPIIASWNHTKLNYADTTANDFIMKVQYESVEYGVGQITSTSGPEGFAVTHYDTVPSPLSSSASGTTSQYVPASDTSNSILTQIAQIKAYQDAQSAATIASVLGTNPSSSISGLSDVSFAVNNAATTTEATLTNLGV